MAERDEWTVIVQAGASSGWRRWRKSYPSFDAASDNLALLNLPGSVEYAHPLDAIERDIEIQAPDDFNDEILAENGFVSAAHELA